MGTRAPYQVLVIPFVLKEHGIEYAILKRSDMGYWQAIAGGGGMGEIPEQSARREVFEETGIGEDCRLIQLDSITSLPVVHVVGHFLWGEEMFVIPEYSFGLEVYDQKLHLSKEHTAYKWVCYEEAVSALKWDSNKTPLWELDTRLNIINNIKGNCAKL
ncbi:NUDIX hydrolase [Fictibacillus norfolkensis]|uniref:NUDIX pyrophosphatase n=1 Tax=Fictibacillus norfolkensis TaxID=2762233 RepID=A0ABR8SKA5_9BACL|nr:NUDIX pyrophosphatase [Fictibacillus norfolkensis]MBD7963918.1 NUDIX pyrophosphatase [Fictibacillus norfolkensis]